MKLTLEHISAGQDEVIIRCRERTGLVDSIIRAVEQLDGHICAANENGMLSIVPSDVLYLESVDDKVFVYTGSEVARTTLTLAAAEASFRDCGFFRCSKSMVINLHHISYLRSIPGSKAEVTMDNGEHVIISRRYVRELRSILKGDEK